MVVIEPFTINQKDSNITKSDTTAGSSTDLLKFKVPKGISILLRPEDVVAMDLDETDASIAQPTDEVIIEVRDTAEQGKRTILGPKIYSAFSASGVGEWNDTDKLQTLEITNELEVKSQEFIVLKVKGTAAIDGDTSAWSLRTHRRR